MTDGLRLDFSSEEASSEARSFEVLPAGKYHVKITDIDLKECGPESKNPGKPYWHLEHVIQDGPAENQHLWTNCMLFKGALYTLAQLLKATGHEDAIQSGNIPPADDFTGKDVYVNVSRQKDAWAMKGASPNDP